MEKSLSRKEAKLQKKLALLERQKEINKQNAVTKIIIFASIGLFILLFAFIAIGKNKSKNGSNLNPQNFSSTGWSIGSQSAKINLIEYSDFQCPACRAYEPLVKQAIEDFKDEINFTYKYFPLVSIHRNSIPSALAAEAAGSQGKFWQMHDLLFAKQDEWADQADPNPLFKSYAKDLNLDSVKFENDLSSKETETKVQKNLTEAVTIGLNGTPSFVLNGKIISTPPSYQDFKKLLSASLK